MTDHAVAIECCDLKLVFPGAAGEATLALSGVSCQFLPGKVTAIIGPSGCGKSTLPVSYTHLTLPTTPYV